MREKKITGKLRKLKKNMYILEETLKVHFSKNLYLTVYTYRFDHNFPLSKLVKVIFDLSSKDEGKLALLWKIRVQRLEYLVFNFNQEKTATLKMTGFFSFETVYLCTRGTMYL